MSYRNMTVAENAKLEAAKKGLVKVLEVRQRKYKLNDMELLALMAYMVGIAIAKQDQTKITVEQAMDLVHNNIVAGNAVAVAELHGAGGTSH